MEFSIVIPAYNEAENIRPLVQEIRNSLNGYLYELIYVDDGSTDDTLAELKAMRANGARELKIKKLNKNCGQSTAIYTGSDAASGNWIITLDADGQNNPADIPAMIRQLGARRYQNKPLLISGLRKKRQDSKIRKISSRIANATRSMILDDRAQDTGCGLKLFNRQFFLQLPKFDHMHRFMPALFLMHGAEVEYIPVDHRPRLNGKSKYGISNRLWVGLTDLCGVLWLKHRAITPTVREI